VKRLEAMTALGGVPSLSKAVLQADALEEY
jgi:hypothetical protein